MNAFRQVADKAATTKSFSKLEQAVIKATRCNLKAPKEKHIRTLLLYTSEQAHRNSEMIDLLAKRLELPEWIVVMKTLIVFHRILRDALNNNFLKDLTYKVGIFSLRKFTDMSSPEAHHQSIFVRKYSQYLEEKIVVFKFVEAEFEKDSSGLKGATADELFDRLPRLQSQLNALINTRASKDHLNNPVIITAWNYLLKDSFKLYRALNDGIITLLEHFFTMPKTNAVKALDIYKLFTRETDGLIQIIEISKRFARSDLPELQHAPTTLVEALENHVKDLESGKVSSGGQKTKELMKETKKTAFSFEEKDLLDFGSGFADSPFDEQGNAKQNQNQSQNPKTLPTNPSFGDFDTLPTNNAPSSPKQAPFDPFGTASFAPSFTPQNSGPSYDDKKKQITSLFDSPTPSSGGFGAPVSQPTSGFTQSGFSSPPSGGFNSPPSGGFNANFASFPPAQPTNQNSGFGSTGFSVGFNSAPSGGFNSAPSGGFNSPPNGGFNANFASFPPAQPTNQNSGFGSSQPNNSNPFAAQQNNPNPFGAQQNQNSNSFNPFL